MSAAGAWTKERLELGRAIHAECPDQKRKAV